MNSIRRRRRPTRSRSSTNTKRKTDGATRRARAVDAGGTAGARRKTGPAVVRDVASNTLQSQAQRLGWKKTWERLPSARRSYSQRAAGRSFRLVERDPLPYAARAVADRAIAASEPRHCGSARPTPWAAPDRDPRGKVGLFRRVDRSDRGRLQRRRDRSVSPAAARFDAGSLRVGARR